MAPSVTPKHTHYALVIDAGSSGSRLQIYSWRDPDLERAEILQEVQQVKKGQGGKKWWFEDLDFIPSKWKGKGKAREDELERTALRRLVRVGKGVEGDAWVKRVEPGISTVTPEDIPAYLAPLLSHALQQIPPSQHASTPIYVLATAGMRLLESSARDAILEATCDTLRSKYPFQVGDWKCSENVRVISGEEEGIWGWVAVNYLMDGFGHAPEPTHTLGASSSRSSGLLPLSPLAEPPPLSSTASVTPVDVAHHSPTFGFLDMGGASTQLAFSPTPQELSRSGFPRSELYNISLRLLSGEDVDWPVFVASWLGYGTNKARDRYIDGLIAKWRKETNGDLDMAISDPCLPNGLVQDSLDSTMPSFKGSGSFSTCLSELRPYLEHDTACPTQHCLFGGVSTPHIDFSREDQRGFIGISEYWYTAQQVLGLGGVWDWGEWEKGMSDFCSRDWESIEKQVEADQGWRGAEVELPRLQQQCFKGAWISNVLHEGIGIPRLVDVGGNDTVTGGSVGDTNTEAERRAREKGLAGAAKSKSSQHSHFQSMDEVGETAISWTLGKMVIEASKAVQPRSAAVEAAWTSRLPQFRFGELEDRLHSMGIQTVWAYGFITFFLLMCIFNALRRRFRWTWSTFPSPKPGRMRKPSVSGDYPRPSKASWHLPWRKETESSYALAEEGLDYSQGSKSPRGPSGTLRLWSLRLGAVLKRNLPSSLWNHDRPIARGSFARHHSMPLTSTSYSSSSNGGWGSQPPSPRSQFFTPGFSVAGGGGGGSSGNGSTPGQEIRHSASTSSITISGSTTPLSSSPPRSKSSRGKPRQNSNMSNKSSSLALSVPDTSINTTGIGSVGVGGWNDPPNSMLGPGAAGVGTSRYTSGDESLSPTEGVLTPLANPRAIGVGGYDSASRPMSRQSSRVNLSELGLAQRSTSRSTTPMRVQE